MKASSTTAQHLAELEAQLDAHVHALRGRVAQAQAAAASAADELAERLDPDPPQQ